MIKNYQNTAGSIKNFVKLLSHCYHNDQAVKMGELHIFLEDVISKEKATDICIDTSQKFYVITKNNMYKPEGYSYDIERFKKMTYETTENPAISRRFETVIENIIRLFFQEHSEEWVLHIVDTKFKWNSSLQEYIHNNEIIVELWCKDIENINVKAEFDKILQKYNIDSNVSTSFKLRNIKYSYTSAGEERIERDILGNIPEPGDTVILLEGGADIFVGFNKASWSCLQGHGYGYVIKKHPVNTNGGEPFKTPEDFNVSA